MTATELMDKVENLLHRSKQEASKLKKLYIHCDNMEEREKMELEIDKADTEIINYRKTLLKLYNTMKA